MKTTLITTPGSPKVLALLTAVNFAALGTYGVTLPKDARYLLQSAYVLSENVDTLTNGGTIAITDRKVDAKTAAALTTALTGANNDLVFTAKTKGTAGNAITVAYVDPAGNNAALSVGVVGTAITVNLATGAGGAITSTSAQIKAAIEASAEANALVAVAHSGADTGAGVVIALAATNLAGGLEYVLKQTVSTAAALADSDAAGKIQALTVAQGSVIEGGVGNELTVAITVAGTATKDEKTVVLELLAV